MRLPCSCRVEKYLAPQEERICSEFVLAELLHAKKEKTVPRKHDDCGPSCSKPQCFERKLQQLFEGVHICPGWML